MPRCRALHYAHAALRHAERSGEDRYKRLVCAAFGGLRGHADFQRITVQSAYFAPLSLRLNVHGEHPAPGDGLCPRQHGSRPVGEGISLLLYRYGLIAKQRRFITGTEFVVDGGITAWCDRGRLTRRLSLRSIGR